MNNRINQNNRINKINFSGIKPNAGGVKTMDELIKKMITDLLTRAEREVAEYGEFRVVAEEFVNPDKSLDVSKFILRVTKPSKELEGNEKQRYLEVVAVKRENPNTAESVIGFGTKEDILNKLKENDLCDKIKKKFVQLAESLEDI